ncbi:MAG: GHKL domain-containing protein [Oscillospiraceae bacterium]|nr:GHKL domain-containing protein [Oscillospiraceae bacterium]
MVSKLKRKFIILATASTILLMTLLVGIMNVVNYSSVVREADATIDVISQPNAPFFDGGKQIDKPDNPIDSFIPTGMSPEVPYESRFFTAMVSDDGGFIETDVDRIVSVSVESAAEYTRKALEKNSQRGFIGDFRYAKTDDGRVTRIAFLDCGRKLDTFRSFMWVSIAMGLLGCVIVFLLFIFVAGRIVRPIAESYAKQKRFITDAGHEIKTPLTIIGANLDLLDDDGNENLGEIRRQTKRLASLTNDLIYLAKMEETEGNLQKVEFPVSDLIFEAAASFKAVAEAQNKEYSLSIQQGLSFNGSPGAVRQLASILLDNAMKYSPNGGSISVFLGVQKKSLIFSVYNTTADPVNEEKISRLFERFYRADSSRSSSTGGYGIGLSIANAIAEAHGGEICARTEKGSDLIITATFPM